MSSETTRLHDQLMSEIGPLIGIGAVPTKVLIGEISAADLEKCWGSDRDDWILGYEADDDEVLGIMRHWQDSPDGRLVVWYTIERVSEQGIVYPAVEESMSDCTLDWLGANVIWSMTALEARPERVVTCRPSS